MVLAVVPDWRSSHLQSVAADQRPFTVAALIEKLQELPPDMPVVVDEVTNRMSDCDFLTVDDVQVIAARPSHLQPMGWSLAANGTLERQQVLRIA